jgi:hypothetical protein
MKKTRIRRHHKHEPIFESSGENKSAVIMTQERMLTAEGFRRRQQVSCDTRPRAIYRGRRQGKKG